jgi:hypothetical protein
MTPTNQFHQLASRPGMASDTSWRVSQIAESRVPHESWRIFRVPEKCHSHAGPSLGHSDGIFFCGIRFFCHLSVTQNVTRYVT